MKTFNPRASLLIDRLLVAKERGGRIARLLLRLAERLFIPRRMQR